MLTTGDFLAITNQFQKVYGGKISKIAADYDMTKVEIDVLLFLYNNPQYNTAKEIVEVRHIAKSYVSKAVDLLVKRGYLCVKEDATDRRVVHLTILDDASGVVEQARKVQEDVLKVLLEGITEEELLAFEKIMRKMAENIEKDKRGEII